MRPVTGPGGDNPITDEQIRELQAADGPCCPGAEVVAVELLHTLVALGVDRAPALGTVADWKRLGLIEEGRAA